MPDFVTIDAMADETRAAVVIRGKAVPGGVVLAGKWRVWNPAQPADRDDVRAMPDQPGGLTGVRPVGVKQQPGRLDRRKCAMRG